MNSLSWFLYLSDVLPSIAGAFTFFGLFILIMAALAYVALSITNSLEDEGTKDYKSQKLLVSFSGKIFIAAAVVSTIGAAVPSKETIYLIAGSEAGEMVIQTPEAQQIINDVHEVIRLQLQNLKEPK